jgi:RHS repeat-associated protein
VRFLTNIAGAVTDTYQYDAFGNQIASTGLTANVYFYSGERFESGLGFYDLRARYYRQSIGRFWSRDPEEGSRRRPQSLHPYLYAWQNPGNLADPTGRAVLVEYQKAEDIKTISIPEVALTGAVISCLFSRVGTTVAALVKNPDVNDLYHRSPCVVDTRPKCKDLHPDLIPVQNLPDWYDYDSESEAWLAIQDHYAPKQLKKGKRDPAQIGPCPVGGQYKPGLHISVQFVNGGGYAGALVGCQCCDDSSGTPTPTQRWGAIPENIN